ncbi:uncharacterized protein LOC111044351 isoform X2 [Nilaparvata lugens]|uniref:uncharacterized protein LOC111044351 isoform X2 n=1 Tax=Nilaparvata lugens TaxID=108931 RepID=UPI00193DB795|nr:uncharacterized protein LOC111044351 isoform X2 [Nilaparvata lugens]
MTKLTEEMIIAKTKQSNFGAIKKMNCWGSELVDVSLLRRLNNIEVLSLSVNKIASLSDFQYCRNLQELFVRKNNIRELNQVCYLQNLPKLVNLWLDENPCTECDGYRLTVIRTLPNLKKLDNVPVDPEELEEALHKGRDLVHPEEEVMMSPEPGPSRRHSRPPAPATVTSHDMENEYYDSESQDNMHIPEQPMNYNHPSPVLNTTTYYHRYEPVTSPVKAETESSITYPDRRLTQPVVEKHDESNVSSSLALDPQMSLKDDGWASGAQGAQGDSSGSESSPSAAGVSGLSRARMSEDDTNAGRSLPPMPYLQPMPNFHQNDHYQHQTDHHQQSADHTELPPPPPLYAAERPRTAERTAARDTHRCAVNHQPPYHRRPTSRNSNILSAVLCLVKELDYPSLEVVDMAIRCRMDELND